MALRVAKLLTATESDSEADAQPSTFCPFSDRQPRTTATPLLDGPPAPPPCSAAISRHSARDSDPFALERTSFAPACISDGTGGSNEPGLFVRRGRRGVRGGRGGRRPPLPIRSNPRH